MKTSEELHAAARLAKQYEDLDRVKDLDPYYSFTMFRGQTMFRLDETTGLAGKAISDAVKDHWDVIWHSALQKMPKRGI